MAIPAYKYLKIFNEIINLKNEIRYISQQKVLDEIVENIDIDILKQIQIAFIKTPLNENGKAQLKIRNYNENR